MSFDDPFIKITSDICVLYELSLAVGQSLDLTSNCDRFLKTLMARKNLGYASVWIRGEHLPYLSQKESGEESDKGHLFVVFAHPESRIREKVIHPHHPILSRLEKDESFSVASSQEAFSCMVTEKDIDRGTYAVFALGELGFLKVFSPREGCFKDEDLSQLHSVMLKFTTSLHGCLAHQKLIREFSERKRTEEALKQSELDSKRLAEENAVIAEVGRIISSTLNIDEVYERFAHEAQKIIPADRIAINLLDPVHDTIKIAYSSGVKIQDRSQGDAMPITGTLSGEVIRSRSGLIIQAENQCEIAARYPGLLPTFSSGLRSLMAVPLISKDQVLGSLHFRSRETRVYSEKDIKLAEKVGNQIAGAIANALLYADHKRAEEALRESEARFKDLFDHAPLGYHEYDLDGRVTKVNHTDEEMLGYSAEEMVGQFVWRFNQNEEETRQEVLARLTGRIPPGRNLERAYQRKDGTPLPVLIEDRLIFDDQGRIKGMRCTIQDITQWKKTKEELANLQEQLRQSQKMEAIGRLAGGVAHDFNNLLTVIKGYSQLSLMALDEETPLRGNIETIQKASERAADLTRQLLAFSRRQMMELKILDLNTLLKDMEKMLNRIIGEDIELVTVLANDLGRTRTDPGQIEQVILNLAVNARDAMPSGGRLTIETENIGLDEVYAFNHDKMAAGPYVLLSVSDTGLGMSNEVMGQIFDPFFTTKEKGKGTGLGLSTVYGIVKQSGGNIIVRSELGRGSIFKIYLPRVEDACSILRRDDTMSMPCGSETVLLAEDETSVRGLAASILKRQGYKVLEASDGNQAFSLAQTHSRERIHLLVTDVVMPQMGGRELADRLKDLRPEMKVLFVSGYTGNAIVHNGILEAGIEFLQKPFSPSALAQKVRAVLDRKEGG